MLCSGRQASSRHGQCRYRPERLADQGPVDLLVPPSPGFAEAVEGGPPREWPPRFRWLPFVAVATGEPAPSGAAEFIRRENYPIERLRLLEGIDWLFTVQCDVANLSVGPRAWGRFNSLDPLHLATQALYDHGIPVVVAAGNDGPESGTLQELARAQWVIAVGATDAEGHLLASSSRGESNGPAPTLVSDGTHPEEPLPGTSFAAPRVARAAVFSRKCLEYFLGCANWLGSTNRDPLGPVVRLPWIGFLDTGWDPEKSPYEWGALARMVIEGGSDAVAIALLPEEERWLRRVLAALGFGERDFTLDAGPESVRRALVTMAQPVAGTPQEVGAGSVTIRNAVDFFQALTPSRVATVLLPGDVYARNQMATLDEELGSFWDDSKVEILADYFASGVRFSVARVL